jgi:hypothetical protein
VKVIDHTSALSVIGNLSDLAILIIIIIILFYNILSYPVGEKCEKARIKCFSYFKYQKYVFLYTEAACIDRLLFPSTQSSVFIFPSCSEISYTVYINSLQHSL